MVLNLMATTAGSVVEKKVALANEKNGDMGNEWLKTHSASCGAYKLISWKANEFGHAGGNPQLSLPAQDQARHRPPRARARHPAPPAGEGRHRHGLEPAARPVKPLAGNKDVKVETFPYSGTWYINMNMSDERLKNPKVRTALRYLVDYQGMANTFLKGAFTVQPDLPADRVPERDQLQPLQA